MSAAEREIAALASGTYARRLALTASAVGDGTASVTMPFGELLLNRGGRMHGGAIASVALAAARLATAASERPDSVRWPWCSAATIAFLNVPSEGVVTAGASVLERGRDLAHVGVDVRDGDGRRVASAALTCALQAKGDAQATTLSTVAVPSEQTTSVVSVTESPYLSAAGIRRFEPSGRVARLRLPFEINAADNPRRIDDGAIAGLVDSCAAFASYLDDGQSFDRRGVTASLTLSFHEASCADAVGAGWVLSRSGSSRVAHVEVIDVSSGHLVASGDAVYRITSS